MTNRATISASEDPGNGRLEQVWSLTATRTQWFVGLLVAGISIFASIFLGVQYVAASEFQRQLVVFHETARPEIYRHVSEMILADRNAGPHPGGLSALEAQIFFGGIREDIAALRVIAETNKEENRRQIRLIEELLKAK